MTWLPRVHARLALSVRTSGKLELKQQTFETTMKSTIGAKRRSLKRHSNYWTAALYFRAQNGTFKRVQQYANIGLIQRGGMTVYYIPPYDGISTVTAFKPVCKE
jgi:hypothetical protein